MGETIHTRSVHAVCSNRVRKKEWDTSTKGEKNYANQRTLNPEKAVQDKSLKRAHSKVGYKPKERVGTPVSKRPERMTARPRPEMIKKEITRESREGSRPELPKNEEKIKKILGRHRSMNQRQRRRKKEHTKARYVKMSANSKPIERTPNGKQEPQKADLCDH